MAYDANPILGFLRQMMAGAPKPPGMGRRDFSSVGADIVSSPAPTPFAPSFTTPFAGSAGPSTKTEPQGQVQFAWGGGTPQDYNAGQTNILQMRGAPAKRIGFMGASPVAGGAKAGGFAPSQTDWSKVANPMAFEAFRQRPMMDEIERVAEDPLWRERETKEMDISGAERIARAEAEAGIQAAARERSRLRGEIATETTTEINRRNQARALAGGKPLTPQEEQEVAAEVAASFGIGLGMRG